MLNIYDTCAQSPGRQFDYWREELCHNFVELAAERPRSGIFDGRIKHFPLHSIGILRVTTDAHRVARTRLGIDRSNDDCYFINLQLDGVALTSQRSADVSVHAGDMVLVDTREPFSVLHEEPFDLICFKVPRDALRAELRQRNLGPLPNVRAASGCGRVLRSYANALIEESESDLADSASVLADNLISLIAGAINTATDGLQPTGQLGTQQLARLHAVQGYIDERLADPDLSLQSAVDRFNLSPRYLQKLFAATGSTFSQTLMMRRLDKAATCLRRRELRGRTIAETAFLCGFNDFSYFNRSFKKRFGRSPRDYRSAYLDR
ncbi:AraC-type DNA-binding protein [Mesorhizobium albiziae]|uniref:AraC-type DNA-binding protein n=1 Tax=Neomesorhizobium albiziae TaxID=335020 RepID=A0A1I4D723_9HYPH|nr:helix-turn-helix domain-containing protein [Mesorhizobium albiziae]GLS33607.1 transcriptional regulator [Mesorhizobium albiziae]SFK89322.1 AraC-type DNA-binding protein [Mesorhizobium albiziae]